MLRQILGTCRSRPDPATDRRKASSHTGTAHALAHSSLPPYNTPGTLGAGAATLRSGRRALAAAAAHLLVGLVEEHAVNRVRLLELHRPLAQLQVVVLAAHGWTGGARPQEAAVGDSGRRSAAALRPAPPRPRVSRPSVLR